MNRPLKTTSRPQLALQSYLDALLQDATEEPLSEVVESPEALDEFQAAVLEEQARDAQAPGQVIAEIEVPVEVPQALSGAGASCLVQWVDASILPSLRELAEACVLSILHQVEAARAQGISALFKQFALRDAWLGLEVVVLEEGKALFSGRAMGIDENGAYLISTSNGLRSVIAGDLSLRVAA